MKHYLWRRRILLLLVSVLIGGCTHVGKTEKAKSEEPVVITWYIRGGDEDLYQNLKGIQEIEKATNTDIQFILAPEDGDDAYKLMIATGKLPDVIQWSYTSFANGSGVNQLYNEGIAIDLTDYIDKYAVNLKKIYTKRPELLKEVQTLENRLIYFPSINPLLTAEDRYRMSYAGLIIRKDWLNNLGYEVPNTIDEWYEVLKAFKERDPNGNGIEDEIPFDGKGISTFLPAFGLIDNFYINQYGEVSYGYLEPAYKSYLETMNQWYMEGLIGKSSFVLSSKWTDANIINNISGSFFGLDNAWRYYLPSILEKDSHAQLEAVPWPYGINGKRYTNRSELSTHIRNEVTIVTNQCKNPEAAVRLIDYFYSEEGSNLVTWGIEGETYEVINGEKKLLPKATEEMENGYIKLYNYAIAHAKFPKYDGETVVLQTYPEEQLVAEKVWADCDTSLIYPPSICFTSEENNTVSNIMTDINAYVSEMTMKYITGEESLTSYDTFLYTIKKMGIDEVLAIYQRNYGLYISK